MKRVFLTTLFFAFFFTAAVALHGQESFSFGFILESPEVPDLDATSTIDGAQDSEVPLTVVMTLASAGITTSEGIQGWSVSIWHAGIEIVSLSVAGTVSAPESEGGLVDESGEHSSFVHFEIVDPAFNEGREGVVQAVVPSHFKPVTLPPNARHLIGRINYLATVTDPGKIAFVRYENGIQGQGQPVENIVTIDGQSAFPDLGERLITIGENVTSEAGNCLDGIDNDNDGFSDCSDPDCFNETSCGFEDCTDGLDNDADGLIDCADADCFRHVECVETCDDGIDNDGDGLIDCDDPECRNNSACPSPEICNDGVDNDEDGLTDCDDPECKFNPFCREPEICDDGIDNDEDGFTDCDDRECFGVGDCPAPENCTDDIDNDRDGLIDCDDEDCTLLAACRGDENCYDGIDNDLDGLTDCDDPQCAGVTRCADREICNNSVDDDDDGLVDCDDPGCLTESPCGGGESGFDLVIHTPGAFRENVDGDGGGASANGNSFRNVVNVSFESEATIEVVTYIVPFPDPQPAGAQGWATSVAHASDVMNILGAPTIEGTDAGNLVRGGFVVNQTAELDERGLLRGRPRGGAEQGAGASEDADGFVTAVVLSFTEAIELNPTVAQSIARASYRLTDMLGNEGFGPALVEFRDGLRGAGTPVHNTLTIGGQSVDPVHFVPLEIRRVPPGSAFIRGDVNDDAKVNIADAIWSINELMRGGPPTTCQSAADANDDERYNIADPVFIVQYRFLHGPTIPAPFPTCGREFVQNELDCPEGSVWGCP